MAKIIAIAPHAITTTMQAITAHFGAGATLALGKKQEFLGKVSEKCRSATKGMQSTMDMVVDNKKGELSKFMKKHSLGDFPAEWNARANIGAASYFEYNIVWTGKPQCVAHGKALWMYNSSVEATVYVAQGLICIPLKGGKDSLWVTINGALEETKEDELLIEMSRRIKACSEGGKAVTSVAIPQFYLAGVLSKEAAKLNKVEVVDKEGSTLSTVGVSSLSSHVSTMDIAVTEGELPPKVRPIVGDFTIALVRNKVALPFFVGNVVKSMLMKPE